MTLSLVPSTVIIEPVSETDLVPDTKFYLLDQGSCVGIVVRGVTKSNDAFLLEYREIDTMRNSVRSLASLGVQGHGDRPQRIFHTYVEALTELPAYRGRYGYPVARLIP